MNKKALALTDEQYKNIINYMQNGFVRKNGIVFKPNYRIAAALIIQANLGLRIGDVLRLRLSNIVREGGRYRLDIYEEKTGKYRNFTVINEIYTYLLDYAVSNNIKPDAKLFDVTERNVQKRLEIVCCELGYKDIGTHSFRKYFATSIYRENNYNIQLVCHLLQHASIATTQRYIGLQPQEIENALKNHCKLI